MENDDDDEEKLLASLEASLHQQDVYEEQVIREATHQLAPPLTGIGFPDLSTLMNASSSSSSSSSGTNNAKGRAAAAGGGTNNNKKRAKGNISIDLPPVHAVLTRVRKSQQEEPHADIHYLKEQMLLHFMTTVAGVPPDDLPVAGDDDRHQNIFSKRRQQALVAVPAAASGAVKKKPKDAQPDTVHVATAHAAGAAASRPRVSIMKRKRQQQKQQQEYDDQQEEFSEESKERRAALKELRRQRERRRAERRRVLWNDNDENSDDEQEMEFGNDAVMRNAEDEKITEKQDETASAAAIPGVVEEPTETSRATQPKSTAGGNSEVDKSGGEAATMKDTGKDPETPSAVAAAAATTNSATVQCPLCQQEVTCVDATQMDSVLASHIGQCQQSSSGTRRRSKRGAAAQRTNYWENDQPDSDHMVAEETAGSDEEQDCESAVGRKSLRKRKVAAKKKAPPQPAADDVDPLSVTTTQQLPFTLAVDDMDEQDYEDRVDEWILNGVENMKAMKERDTSVPLPGEADLGHGLIVPAWVNDRLFGYQREGLLWMWDLHRQQAGGILGDEMGLGKTVSASSYLGVLASCRKLKSVLIVAPATMLQHWLTELAVWAPGLRRILIHQSAGDKDSRRSISRQLLRSLDGWLNRVRAEKINECIDEEDRRSMPPHSFCGTGVAVITTYENVRRNPDIYIHHSFTYVFADEAQTIRNPEADITLVMKRLRTPHRIAMSGTPIQNNLKELWSIFDFVFPGRLGTLPTFEQEFADPIKRGGYSNASPMQVQLAYRCALVLRDLINPYLLRRQKKDVKEMSRLPGKTEHVLFCRLSERQRALYETYLQSDEVARVVRGSNQLLGAITMLRKICNHPDLVCAPEDGSIQSLQKNGFPAGGQMAGQVDDDDDDGGVSDMEDYDEESVVERAGKLEVLSKILPLWKKQGHRVIIFCQWKKMLNIIQRFVMLQGWKFGRLDGNTSVAARQRLVDSFNSDESYFGMLATTRTGGVGLNMTGANRIILYDPDWNPQTDAQARERAWRFGQEREVTVYRLITAGTVEEKVYQRQIFKTALSNKVLQDPRQRRLFSQRDLRDLFTLKEDTGSYRSGGDGVTETVDMAKGQALDLDDTNEAKDNEATLKSVMKSKGLAGVFDHQLVEEDSSRKSVSAREMEEKAKNVARQAVRALQQSVASVDLFTPTPTGRFGGSAVAASAGVGGRRPSTNASGSSGLLASLKQRDAAVRGKGDLPGKESERYAKLLSRIEKYVRRQRPTTDELLNEFCNIPDGEGAIFRRLLKSVAVAKNGRWHLQSRG